MSQKAKFWGFSVVFLLSVLLVFCAGYYRKSITQESGRFELKLLNNGEIATAKTVVYDIQNEGAPKKLCQTDRISISTGHGSGVLNNGEQPIWLQVEVSGVNGTAKVSSTNPIFDGKSGCCLKPLLPGEKLYMNVNLDLADDALKNYLVSRGKIEFYDSISSKKLGEVPLKIVNSKPQNSCCTYEE